MRAIQQQQHGGERNNNNNGLALGSSSPVTIGVAGGSNVHGRASSEIESTTTTVNEPSSLAAAIQIINDWKPPEAMSSLLHGTVTSAGVVERVDNGTNSISGEILREMCFALTFV
jgi:hypothetical protein